MEEIVADARWEDLAIARKRILGEPNNLKENLFNAAAALGDPVQIQKAKVSAREREGRRLFQSPLAWPGAARARVPRGGWAEWVLCFSSRRTWRRQSLSMSPRPTTSHVRARGPARLSPRNACTAAAPSLTPSLTSPCLLLASLSPRRPADFDTVGKPTGAENARFADFSTKAVRAANAKINEFLRLMPSEDVEAARSQLAPPPLTEAAAAAGGGSEF